MNPKSDRWEIYVDSAGRRHWRWPASNAAADGQVEVDSRQRTVTPAQQQQAHFSPLLQRGK